MMNEESKEYFDKIIEMLTMPKWKDNGFLINLKQFIQVRKYITWEQKDAVDEMEQEVE